MTLSFFATLIAVAAVLTAAAGAAGTGRTAALQAPFYSESLDLQPLPDAQKQLAKFSFVFRQPAHEIDAVSAQNYVFSRSVLESVFLRPNATRVRIESACGTINPIYVQRGVPGFEESDFPQNGVKLYIDEYANYELLIEALNEIFRITKANIRHQNHFLVKNDIQVRDAQSARQDDIFASNFVFAQDPTDFICSDNIEKLRQYFPCLAQKGLLAMLDQNMLFRGDYIGLTSDLHLNREEQTITIKIDILVVAKRDQNGPRAQVIPVAQIGLCPTFNETWVREGTHAPARLFTVKDAPISFWNFSAPPYNETARNGGKEQQQEEEDYKKRRAAASAGGAVIATKRYNTDKWFEFNGTLVHEVENLSYKEQVDVVVHEYLIWQCQPQMHKVVVYSNGNALSEREVQERFRQELEVQRDNYYLLRFSFRLKARESIRFVIPIDKLMKTFENYPHDPQRGHDIIAVPVLYRALSDTRVRQITAENTIVHLPEPDFSMPFNIITYTCVMMGYVYLIIFQISAHKSF